VFATILSNISLNSSNDVCYSDPENRGKRGSRGGRKRTRNAGPNRTRYPGHIGKHYPAPKVKRYAARTLKQKTVTPPPTLGTRPQFGGARYDAKKEEDKKGKKKKTEDDDEMDVDEDKDDDMMDVDEKSSGKLTVAFYCHCCCSHVTTTC
jgi:hypothetical protein